MRARRNIRIPSRGQPEDIDQTDLPPSVIPEGRYAVVVLGVQEKQSQYHNLYYQWELMVIRPWIHENFRLYHITSMAPTAVWRIREFLEAAGEDLEPGAHWYEMVPDNFIGKTMVADVKISTFNSKTVNQVFKLSRWD